VDQHMQELLSASAVSDEVLHLFELGLNHEQHHQELRITDIKHAFWSNPLRPAYQSGATSPSGSTAPQKAKGFPGGILEIGADGSRFHFDHAALRHKVFVPAFRFATR